MITPNYLKKGDKVALVAPAKQIAAENYSNIVKYIENKGFVVVRGKSTYKEFGPFAGTDTERTNDLQTMLNNKDIKAIFCIRGGYGCVRILDNLKFDKLIKHPKWLIGFSDICVLHSAVYKNKVESLHAQMPVNFPDLESKKGVNALFEVLMGNKLHYQISSSGLNKYGKGKGKLIGGNLAVITSLIGTKYDIKTKNTILFIEDVGEYLYKFDRMMHQLKLSGKLDNLNGLIIGGLSGMKDNEPNFPLSVEEIVNAQVKDYSYPICFSFPAGHIADNFPLILGRKVELNVNSKTSDIKFYKK